MYEIGEMPELERKIDSARQRLSYQEAQIQKYQEWIAKANKERVNIVLEIVNLKKERI